MPWLARAGWYVDRSVDAVLDRGIAPLTARCATVVAAVQSENYSWYIVCSLAGGVLIALFLLAGWA